MNFKSKSQINITLQPRVQTRPHLSLTIAAGLRRRLIPDLIIHTCQLRNAYRLGSLKRRPALAPERSIKYLCSCNTLRLLSPSMLAKALIYLCLAPLSAVIAAYPGRSALSSAVELPVDDGIHYALPRGQYPVYDDGPDHHHPPKEVDGTIYKFLSNCPKYANFA